MKRETEGEKVRGPRSVKGDLRQTVGRIAKDRCGFYLFTQRFCVVCVFCIRYTHRMVSHCHVAEIISTFAIVTQDFVISVLPTLSHRWIVLQVTSD